MYKLRHIFILLISLLAINGGNVNNISISDVNKHSVSKEIQSYHRISVDNIIEDSFPNQDFDLEEDTDDTDNDFLGTIFSKNIVVQNASPPIYQYSYSYSHQSVKRFILYCSLKLHC